MEVREYLTETEASPFSKWFLKVHSQAAAKIAVAITRMELGNLSNCKSLGGGLWENKLAFGPGYRIYFGKEGSEIIILLAAGTKGTQSRDIVKAKKYWHDYKKRRRALEWH